MTIFGSDAPISTLDSGSIPQFDGQKFVAGPNAPNMSAINNAGGSYTERTHATSNWITSVCYGTGIFVAVSTNGTANRVVTSPDGITWTARDTTGKDNQWNSVCFGKGLFVAVADSGTANRVMTSPDGITWTLQSTAGKDNSWISVCYGNGRFVAVSYDGSGNRAMYSDDGITWTLGSSAANNYWRSVCFGWVNNAPLFVAVSSDGTNNRVMTSPNGATWTSRDTTSTVGFWVSVCYGNGLFVAANQSGNTTDSIMTSPDGITWALRTGVNGATVVCYFNGIFVAYPGLGISSDGITWPLGSGPQAPTFANAICYGAGRLVYAGSGGRVATSGTEQTTILARGRADGSVTVTVATEGQSLVIPNSQETYIVAPAGGLTSLTLAMPTAPVNGQMVTIGAGANGVTNLTLNPSAGQTFATGAAITTLPANARASYEYRQATARWYRIG